MTRRLLESLSGIGAIHAGDALLRRTRYDLSLWSGDTPDGADEPHGAVASIEGHIDITGISEALVLAGADPLTLTLEDGRQLRFQLTSSGGGIVARGWLT